MSKLKLLSKIGEHAFPKCSHLFVKFKFALLLHRHSITMFKITVPYTTTIMLSNESIACTRRSIIKRDILFDFTNISRNITVRHMNRQEKKQEIVFFHSKHLTLFKNCILCLEIKRFDSKFQFAYAIGKSVLIYVIIINLIKAALLRLSKLNLRKYLCWALLALNFATACSILSIHNLQF